MFENLKYLSTDELSYLATTFAVTVSKDLDIDSLKVLGSLLVGVGGTLNLIANQRILLSDNLPDNK